MIIGTAGHIDHGKTALVRALTGVDTDRLPEEKKRGITIELGFAPLTIPGIGVVSIVDVPGHEAFVRTMVAGAAGIDVALLVVAADEGVMPQTREHIAILDLLGVQHAVVALTKCDLVDATWRDMVEQDVRRALEQTTLAGAPCVHVSVVSGSGVDALREALAASARGIAVRVRDDLARLPIDRVFAKAGAGTVVTGTLWSGGLAVGDAVRILPKGLKARVRALQTHGVATETVGPANRVAIALAGIATDEVARGDVVVSDDAWSPTTLLRADVTLLRGSRPLTARSRVRLHVGTADVGARIVCVGTPLETGTPRAARVVIDTPITARGGDRFVIRRGTDGTIGGGVITDALPPKQRTRPFPRVHMPAADRLVHILGEAGTAGVSMDVLAVRLGDRRSAWRAIIASIAAAETIDGYVVARSETDAVRGRVLAWLDDQHSQHPAVSGAPLEGARAAARAAGYVTEHVVGGLAASGAIVVSGALISRAGWRPKADPDAELCRTILRRLEMAGSAPPPIAELQREFPRPVLPLLRRLEKDGQVVALAIDRFATLDAANSLWGLVRAQVEGGRGYRPTELKAAFGLSRQYLMPWLEYFDRRGWTRRQGDERWFVI